MIYISKVSIHLKTFFSEMGSLDMILTLVLGLGQLFTLAPCIAPICKFMRQNLDSGRAV